MPTLRRGHQLHRGGASDAYVAAPSRLLASQPELIQHLSLEAVYQDISIVRLDLNLRRPQRGWGRCSQATQQLPKAIA